MSIILQDEVATEYIQTPLTNSLFANIVKSISREWPEFMELDRDTLSVRSLIQNYQLDNPHVIDYENQALAFNKAYFFKNLYKTLVVLENASVDFSTHRYLSLIDVGAGAGTFTIAWHAIFGALEYPVTLLDKSTEQLAIAKRILDILKIDKTCFKTEYFIPTSITDVNFRLFSYWFCEQPDLVFASENTYFKNILGANGIILDYSEVISKISKQIRDDYIVQLRKFQVEVPSSFALLFNKSTFAINTVYYNAR